MKKATNREKARIKKMIALALEGVEKETIEDFMVGNCWGLFAALEARGQPLSKADEIFERALAMWIGPVPKLQAHS